MRKKSDESRNSILCDQLIRVLEQLNIGAFITDFNRHIISFNRSAEALTGLEDVEVIGKDCKEVFRGIPCQVKCPFQEGWGLETETANVEVVDERNTPHLVTRLTTPVYDTGQKVAGCLTILQDHSPLADLISRINYDERSMKIILDNLNIGIFTVNRGGHITFFNTVAERISGYNRRQVLGRPCSVIFSEGAADDLIMLKESIADGQIRTNQRFRMTTLDGEVIPIRADYMALQNEQGRTIGGLVALQDLTLAHEFDQFISDKYTFHQMIGKDPVMQKIFDMADVVAKTEATVLIEGATGTGKDLLAKVIHSASKRAGNPFIKVNCAAIPENLLESELFGYSKGAFTGADRDKSGRFQEADGGTIFLDEIGDLSLSLQAKLLRVLEDREFYPLGSRHTNTVDVRIISATNRDLGKLVTNGLFREDLYYRLNVLRIDLPILKDRKADLPLLIRHIMRKLCAAKEDPLKEISESAMEILLNYTYPGNIRELENILEHALIVCKDEIIQPEHLPIPVQNYFPPPKDDSPPIQIFEEGLAEVERKKILWMLQQNNWHRENTARALGMDRTTLWRKMKKFGLTFKTDKH
ncbi:MAG: sigma 54-interacting transcriptional regulator [Deltaproteobacteria bacterium]|nr:sigma 54-interacting transcriptional regulator [Deltaproteobacteria bacterium]MBW1845988.1 sigma 54-interacting transcriptional regulator [Deltaproteobacteria bacterium]MBW2179527.1 sigma 54-interacting transcriptional regulator [Deltaproteobacteria bacterium]MBW2363700.1 sigma 54-interacting transcriptional regulator [Deltaproteobacteria bacterium]